MYENEIKSSVTMYDVCNRYGINVDRQGKLICPFHSDTNPSMSIFANGKRWTCFVCNESGDVIDFVSRLHGTNHIDTVSKINAEFGLNLPIKSAETKQQKLARLRLQKQREAEKQAKNKALYRAEQNYWIAFDLWRYYSSLSERLKPNFLETPTVRWLRAIEKAEHYKAEIEYADINRRKLQEFYRKE